MALSLCPPVPSILWQMTGFHSLLWLYSSPNHTCTLFSLPTSSLMIPYLHHPSCLLLLGVLTKHRSGGLRISFHLHIYVAVGLLDSTAVLFLTLKLILIPFSLVAVWVYNTISSGQVPFLHRSTCAEKKMFIFYFFDDSFSTQYATFFWFWFVSPWVIDVGKLFIWSCWPFVCLHLRDVQSNLLLILKLDLSSVEFLRYSEY